MKINECSLKEAEFVQFIKQKAENNLSAGCLFTKLNDTLSKVKDNVVKVPRKEHS
jgi:hypothetical protein